MCCIYPCWSATRTDIFKGILPAEHYLKVVKGKWNPMSLLQKFSSLKRNIASYNAETPIEKSDREGFSLPVSIRRQMAMKYLHIMARNDSGRFDALEKAGFNVERYGDIAYVLFERLGGHYMDVGASAKISQGLVSHKNTT